MRDRRRVPGGSEQGFGLIELIVVMVILAMLMAMAVHFGSGSKDSTRNTATRAAGSAVLAAVSQWNRDHPMVGGTDPLLAAPAWTGNSMSPAEGLFDRAGRPYLADWPRSPYTARDLVIRRGPCGTPAVGEVLVCRPVGPRPGSFRVIATGRKGGTPLVVFDKSVEV